MLSLSCLAVFLLLSVSYLSASAQHNSNTPTAANITFTRLTTSAPFPATFTAGSAYLTTTDITVIRDGANATYPANSWLLLAGSADSATNGTYNEVWITSNGVEWQLWNGVAMLNGSTVVAGQTNASYWPVSGAASCRDNSGHYFVVAGDHLTTNSSTAVPSYASTDSAQHFQPTHYNTTSTPMPPRSFPTCMASSAGTVVVVGGKSLTTGGSGMSDVWAFDVDWSEDGVQADDWHLLANASVEQPRYGHASAVAFGQGPDCIDVMYVTGGKNSGNGSSTTTTYYNDVLYSVDGGSSWQPRNSTSALWSPRAFHSLTVAQSGLLIVAGGQNETAVFNDVWLSFNGGFDWVMATNAAGFQPRSGHALLIDAQGSPVVIGGSNYYSPPHTAYNDVWTLTTLSLNNLNATATLLSYNLTTPCVGLPGLDCTDNCPVREDFTTKLLIAGIVLGLLFGGIVGFLLWSRRSGPHKQLQYEEEEVYEEEYEEEEEEDTAYTRAPH